MTACVVCKGTEFATVLTSYPWGYPEEPRDYQRCANCGVVREDPSAFESVDFDLSADVEELSEEERRQFQFKFGEAMDVVSEHGELYEMYSYEDPTAMTDDLVSRVLGVASDGDLPTSARVLEVGCANGFLLRALEEHRPEWDLLGVDPSPISHAQATALGTTTVRGTLEDMDAGHGEFDLIFALGNLMLHPDPGATIAGMAARLAPGGRILIDVKNLKSASRSLALGLGRLPLQRVGPVRAFVTRNFTNMRFVFGKEHIVRLVERTGLEVTETMTLPPRALAFKNSHSGSNGIAGTVWRLFDGIDRMREERAWIQVVARNDQRPGGRV